MTTPTYAPRDLLQIEAEARRLRAETLAAFGRALAAWVIAHLPGKARQPA